MQATISSLSAVTGLDRRTIEKRVSGLPFDHQGNAGRFYDSADALAAIYRRESLDAQAEKARLTHHQANLAALKESEIRATLIPADAVADRWQMMRLYAEDLLALLPRELAEAAIGADTSAEIERRFMVIVRRALTDFAENGGSAQ